MGGSLKQSSQLKSSNLRWALNNEDSARTSLTKLRNRSWFRKARLRTLVRKHTLIFYHNRNIHGSSKNQLGDRWQVQILTCCAWALCLILPPKRKEGKGKGKKKMKLGKIDGALLPPLGQSRVGVYLTRFCWGARTSGSSSPSTWNKKMVI